MKETLGGGSGGSSLHQHIISAKIKNFDTNYTDLEIYMNILNNSDTQLTLNDVLTYIKNNSNVNDNNYNFISGTFLTYDAGDQANVYNLIAFDSEENEFILVFNNTSSAYAINDITTYDSLYINDNVI